MSSNKELRRKWDKDYYYKNRERRALTMKKYYDRKNECFRSMSPEDVLKQLGYYEDE